MPKTSTKSAKSKSGPTHFRLALSVLLLLVLTAWNVSRTGRLVQALDASERHDQLAVLEAGLDVLDRRPWSRTANRLVAEALSRLDYPDAAEPYYRRLDGSPDGLSLDDRHVRAYGLVRSNQRLAAINAYEEILKVHPADVKALRLLGGIQITQANDAAVLEVADRLIAIPDGQVFGYTLRGVIHHGQKNREESVAAFEKVTELDPELKVMPLPQRVFWGYFAYDLIDIGRTAEVRRFLTRVLEKTDDSYLMDALGRAYYLDGDIDQAEASYLKAAAWDPNDPVSRLGLGKIEIHRRQQEKALPYLEQAVALSPNKYDAVYTLATTYRQLGRIADADRLQLKIDEIRNQALDATTAPPNSKKPLPNYAL